MATEFAHGVRMNISSEGYIPLRVPSTAVIGIIGTANEADIDIFPLDRCVLVTDIPAAIAKLGDEGTLKDALMDINKEVRTNIVVIRVNEESDDEPGTIANIMGDIDEYEERTGLEAFSLATAQTGLQPRIFICPKYDEDESVAKKLGNIAKEFYGMAYVSYFNKFDTIADALSNRDSFSSDNVVAFYNNAMAYDRDAEGDAERYSIAQIAGLRAKIDIEKGWHWSLSNHRLAEVTGVNKEVTYEPINPEGTQANTLNEAGLSVIVQDQGFKTWGNRTLAASDSPFYFEVGMRSSQVLAITLANLLSDLLQDRPMSPKIMETFRVRGNRLMDDWTRAGYILGGRVILDPDKNSIDNLMIGRPDWAVEFTYAIPIESPGITVYITDEFVLNALSA